MWTLSLLVSCPRRVGWSLGLEGLCLDGLRLSESGKKGSGGPAVIRGRSGQCLGL